MPLMAVLLKEASHENDESAWSSLEVIGLTVNIGAKSKHTACSSNRLAMSQRPLIYIWCRA